MTDRTSPAGSEGGAVVRPLKAIAEPESPPPAPAPPEDAEEASEEGSGRGRVVIGILAFLLLLCLVFLGVKFQENQALTEEVATLGDALTEAQGEVAAHETHLLRIRQRVGSLVSELGSLEALVAEDPTASEMPDSR